jgi:cell division septum initiation protein DivIVA
VLPASSVHAAAADASANAAAMFRLQSSVQRLTQENAELQAQLDAREAELATLRGATAATPAAAAPARADAGADARVQAQLAARYEENLQRMNTGIERARAQVMEIAGKYRELAATLRKAEGEREAFARDGERHLQRSLACEAQNGRLRTLALEALDRYEGKGWWESVLAAEPFTQLARVRLENQVDEYRRDVEALYVDAGGVPSALPERRAAPGSAPAGAGEALPPDTDDEGDEPVFEDYPMPGDDAAGEAQMQ